MYGSVAVAVVGPFRELEKIDLNTSHYDYTISMTANTNLYDPVFYTSSMPNYYIIKEISEKERKKEIYNKLIGI